MHSHQKRTLFLIPVLRLGALLLMALTASGCLFRAPMTPYPSITRAPHPLRVPAELAFTELEALYTVSPDRNPDGLGQFELLWPQSFLSLRVWELERVGEEQERIAYARSEEEQRTRSREREQFYRNRVVFKGLWISYFKEPVDPTWYSSGGVYLVDDRGRKFYPLQAEQTARELHRELRVSPAATGVKIDQQGWVAGHPLLVFPGEALSSETRALFLYLAAERRRVRFAWVFDPSYTPPKGEYSPLEGDEVNRFWSPPRP